jgi:hypothetical protein
MNTSGVAVRAPTALPSPSPSATPTPSDIYLMLADDPRVYQSLLGVRHRPGRTSPLERAIAAVGGPVMLRVVRFLPFVSEHAEAGEV